MSRINRRRGFTIVELLIVIVVVAILATITVVSYNGVQQRAQVSALANGFKQIGGALRLASVDEGRSVWWNDKDPVLYSPAVCTVSASCPGNPKISDIILTISSLKKYLSQEPDVNGLAGTFKYDNDGEDLTATSCSQQITPGVNIYFSAVTSDVAQALDTTIDDGNLTTGRVGFNNGNQIFYKVSCVQGL